jgi:hypothetical protein
MVEGTSYSTKRQQVLTFIGRLDYHFIVPYRENTVQKKGVVKKFVFWDGKQFIFQDNIKNIAKQTSDAVIPNFAELRDKYPHGSKVVELFTKTFTPKDQKGYWISEQNGEYVEFTFNNKTLTSGYGANRKEEVVLCLHTTCKISMNKGFIYNTNYNGTAMPPGYGHKTHSFYGGGYYGEKSIPWFEPTFKRLYAKLESGAKFRIEYGSFREKTLAKDDVLEEEFV